MAHFLKKIIVVAQLVKRLERVTRLGNLLDFGQLFKAFRKN